MSDINGTKTNGITCARSLRIFPETDGDDIVISGMAGKFPNSHNVAEYEYNLYNKIDMVDEDERRWRHYNPEIPRRSGKIYDIEKFDATFFGINFKHANTMDPQGRLLLEIAYEAILDAGINPKSLNGSKTGVYIGVCEGETEGLYHHGKSLQGGLGVLGCSRALLANRISYALGLNGPSIAMDTGCSSSIYALDNAFTALRNGVIDAAIVGGTNLTLNPFLTLNFLRVGVLSSDGVSRPFDKDASGYTRAEAVNCIFLQRKRDAKRIYASIVYSKTNSDGNKVEGLTYPSRQKQEELLRTFYDEVNISPENLGFFEAHGTGTVVGDPQECDAIDNAVCSRRTAPLFVGSVKSNIGHGESASGVNSVIKACLAFQSRKIAPNLHFKEVRPQIAALVEGRLVVVQDVTPLEKPYIGVNSFGFGGANAHVLLKGLEKSKVNNGVPEDDIPRLVTWAGRSEESLHSILDDIGKRPLDAEFLALLHNIQTDESAGMVFRGFGICCKGERDQATVVARQVQHYAGIKRPVVWVFSGMGSQWSQMGSNLMIIPTFRQSIERCHAVLAPKGLDLIRILTSGDATIFDNILHSFVGIAAVQIALVDVLKSVKLEPDYIIGHSGGELGCGYADGGFTLEQTILGAYYRGKVSLDIGKVKGSMAAVGIGFKKIVDILPKTIEVACHNSADSCTISGPADDVAKFVEELKSKDIFAKEVPCSNIAYHSRYIAHMAPQLLKYLQQTIPNPKPRSAKWLSSSVPKSEWNQPEHNLCSAEYYTNNQLNSVLFEETFALLPSNSLTIEIAPHGLLQSIIKRSMKNGVHIPLTQRGSKNGLLVFLEALGRLFMHGIHFPVQNLYPKVEFPVSCGTPGISSLMRWDHKADWFVMKHETSVPKIKGERTFSISLSDDEYEYISGHVIDGRILVPGTFYIQCVWKTFSHMYHGLNFTNVPVEFEDVKFMRATYLAKDTKVDLTVMIHYGTGNFEITEKGALVATGKITEIENPTIPKPHNFKENSDCATVGKKDFYKELKLRGYHYNESFEVVRQARIDGLYGILEWNYDWVTFMDGMIQVFLIGADKRCLLLPTSIQKLRINGSHHLSLFKPMDPKNSCCEVFCNTSMTNFVAGGIEITGLRGIQVQRRIPPAIPVLEKYQFLPHLPTPAISVADAARVCIQFACEMNAALKYKIVEVDTHGRPPILSNFLDSLEDLPLITGEYIFLSSQSLSDIPSAIQIQNNKLSDYSRCDFIIVSDLSQPKCQEAIKVSNSALADGGYLVIREHTSSNLDNSTQLENFNMLAAMPIMDSGEVILLLQKIKKNSNIEPLLIKISDTDHEFTWLEELQHTVANKTPVVVYAFNEKFNGLIGLVNCIRKEPDGNLVTAFFVDDFSAPPFNLNDPFYGNQLALNLPVNVYKRGKWGSYRHLQLNTDEKPLPRSDHVYGNLLHIGDMSALRWYEGPCKEPDIKVAYAALNFRDVMLASGRLSNDNFSSSRLDQEHFVGFEFSGIEIKTGRRLMGMVRERALASYVQTSSICFSLEVPDSWSLREAATVPVVYMTVYYSFFGSTDIRKGKSILIHSGTGGVGLAAIRVALAHNLEVFTTCSTPYKKKYLLETFPQLRESHIGNSRDTSFELMINRETNGKGVDFVLNSLSEDKLLASIRCLAFGGHFLEMGKYDIVNDSKLGMRCFRNRVTFHPIMVETFGTGSDVDTEYLVALMRTDIERGIIKPLPTTVFPAPQLEGAFRYLGGGTHIGKVVIQMREDPECLYTFPISVLKQTYFDPKLSYIIPGGLGGFGLELADWIVMRGARHIVLSSRRGITQGYQNYRISLWKSYGCSVKVSTCDIKTYDGCSKLIEEAAAMAPVGGIFNLAVVLHDGNFLHLRKSDFLESFGPKAAATIYLDELSRKKCPKLEHFVVFSSVSCGRGNIGQTNYGMANSIMERVVEDRVANGYPGKAIQWGAVGEVGLVAELAEHKIDMVIGGTLQQRISSCLEELDKLLSTPDAIVCSMVVAEKRQQKAENIVQVVMNTMGIRDLKSVSLGANLTEMGMDSLTALEIKQILERDFDVVLNVQSLRTLNFQKLLEMSKERERESTDVVSSNGTLTWENDGQLLKELLSFVGDEVNFGRLLLELNNSSADIKKLSKSPVIFIPGIEGTASQIWYNIGSHIKSSAVMLQHAVFSEMSTLQELAHASFKHIKSILKIHEPFYIIGYSFGSFLALQLAGLLEKAGYHGQLLLIDGAPHLLTTFTKRQLSNCSDDNDIYDLLLSFIISVMFPAETEKSAALIFRNIPTIDQKVEKYAEYIANHNVYSTEYAVTLLHGICRRLKMSAKYDLTNIEQLNVPITLIRPSIALVKDMTEDCSLGQITKAPVVTRTIDGTHSSILENPMLWQIINEFDPAGKYEGTGDKYIDDSRVR